MTSGMEMAAALYRLIYGTREAVVMMCKSSGRNADNNWQTVQQKFYSSHCCSICAQAGRSITKRRIAFIVVMIVVETQKERRDAVIQLKLFYNCCKQQKD